MSPRFAQLALCALLSTSAWADEPADPGPAQDSDADGIPDEVERRSDTDPYDADTDDDSVPDGEEDADHDGHRDPGESDPRVAGLFPGRAPHIPEPMLFDLVRGLGAHRGEVETNVLMSVFPKREGWGETLWAPEVEWALLDDFALELELPMVDRELVAVKMAAQYTLPSSSERFAHGLQGIVEGELHQPGAHTSLLYLSGLRLKRWSLFAMTGWRGAFTEGTTHHEALFNPSVFVDVHETVTLGLENNIALGEVLDYRLLPQVHWQISQHVRLQTGPGLHWDGDRIHGMGTARIILE